MYEVKVREHFSGVPVFKLADLTQIIQNKDYAKKFLRKAIERGYIKKIKRDFYTLHDDPLLVSTFLVKPSYISSVSALSYHRLITQIPNEIFCFTTKRAATIGFISKINFLHTRYFFGFRLEEYDKFHVPVATPEKAIIDSLGTFPVSVFEEALDNIDIDLMLSYLKKIRKSSVIKRIGYLAEKNGFHTYEKLKGFINNRYVFLDPLAKRKGERDRKWRIILNI